MPGFLDVATHLSNPRGPEHGFNRADGVRVMPYFGGILSRRE
jgi:hypothetical protein